MSKQFSAVEAQCWQCGAVWNISLLKEEDKPVKCKCGGYVVTPSGKAMVRTVEKTEAPLLDKNTYDVKDRILTGDPEYDKKKQKEDFIDKIKNEFGGLYKGEE